MEPSVILRHATLDDAPVLGRHRRGMIEDIMRERGKPLGARDWAAVERGCADFARTHLSDVTMQAWVIEVAAKIVASGQLSLYWWPGGEDPRGQQVGFLHSMYTDPAHRRRGYARQIVEAALEWGTSHGLGPIMLTYSEAGKSLYESLGFKPYNAMRVGTG